MNAALLNKEVQDYISENYNEDISAIILRGSPFPDVPVQDLATQLVGKKKAEKKLPTWFKTPGIVFPPALNLEQTSSEKTAAYKTSLVNGEHLVDLTGGFGIDSYYFSKRFREVVHCELNASLSPIVTHNFDLLGAENIVVHTGNSLEYLQGTARTFDCIYTDPSRRDDAGGRVFLLSDCMPNIPENLDLLFRKSPQILIKTSPLLDIRAGLSELKEVREIHILAIENDVKELLWVLKTGTADPLKVRTVNFRKNGEDEHFSAEFTPSMEINFSPPLTYLFEPNAAIMKSGLSNSLGKELDLLKLHPNSQLFTSEELKQFPGRRFEILKTLPYHKKKLRKSLDLEQANITTRNFPLSVESLRKQLKIGDGGEYYLFFTTLHNEEKVCVVCRKV